MKRPDERPGTFGQVIDYFRHLPDSSPYWRAQATAIGIAGIAVIGVGIVFAVFGLYAVFGGGTVSYEAKGSPGPVTFRHYSHMWFKGGKYKECKTCHEDLFAAQTYGTFVLRTLRDSPETKVRIGRETSTLYVPNESQVAEARLVTYQVPRACLVCATGECHNGKESFSRLECLKCHQRR